ncbi:hypothetical protein [Sphingomonas sp. AP4-R1]|uniref:hypothetical protein n=1 Tax=Sphingomonas sp. AP4-R1 TaxID=2735134 RepID=UPI0020A2C734|nr:hypothetical protein [Sphingomonas sp. AP4-R1]
MILLAALALILRILIPSGWMPAADRIGLMPCFGTVSAGHAAAAMDHAGHHAAHRRGDHPDDGKSDRPCAFAGFACALAEPDVVSGPPLVPLAAPILLGGVAAAARIGAGLAAPPPPPTGPPVTP